MSDIKIIVSGKEYGLFFGYTAYKRLRTSLFNNPVIFLKDGQFTDEGYVEILHGGYENYCLQNKVKAELTPDDISKWLDETYATPEGKEAVNNIFKAWEESIHVKAFIEETEKKSPSAEQQPLNDPNLMS